MQVFAKTVSDPAHVRYPWFLHATTPDPWHGAEGQMGHGFTSKEDAEQFARDHCLAVVEAPAHA